MSMVPNDIFTLTKLHILYNNKQIFRLALSVLLHKGENPLDKFYQSEF